MDEIRGLYREARQAAAWGVAVSLGLGAVKLGAGWLGHSFALAADALHSLADALISAALLGALVVAERPADREHPYGHARAEALAGAGVALFLIALALAMGAGAVGAAGRDRPGPHAYTLVVAGLSALVQESLYHFSRRTATRTGSRALLATSWDFRVDALGSLAVLAALGVVYGGGPSWRWVDRAAAAVVAVLILGVGARLFWDHVQELMDRQAAPELLDAVRREAEAVAGVRGVETLRVRKIGLEYLVDIHVEVDPDRTVRDGHAIAHRVKDHLIARVRPIRDVLVHVEPAPSPSVSKEVQVQQFEESL